MTDCSCSSHGGFLTAKGLGEAAQREVDCYGVDAMWSSGYLDRVGSVSALAEAEGFHVWDDGLIEEQHRRFHNGS